MGRISNFRGEERLANSSNFIFRPAEGPDLTEIFAAVAAGIRTDCRDVILQFAELSKVVVDVARLNGVTEILWFGPRNIHVFT